MFKRLFTLTTHRIYNLPIIVLMPHSRCNCRCVMCDIWKANSNKKEITREEIERHVKTFRKLDVREIVFSGGEALMHSNLWNLCEVLKENDIKLTLLSTGLLLEKNASDVVRYIDQVIISIDGSQEVHDRIRNIPHGFEKIKNGINALRKLNSHYPVTARSVVQRYNYKDFINTVKSAKEIGIDQISFLPADISTSAFNHEVLNEERLHEIALSKNESEEFDGIIRQSFLDLKPEYDSKFIAERPEKMLRIVQYYKSINGVGKFSSPVCNAPWVSAVIESNGDVMPCFFHKPYGNIYNEELLNVLNSASAIRFRKELNMTKDPVCKKCVCSLKLGLTQMN
jgi:MoaA/NifB/PqqE/SkfB family radical SAM enzyme